MPDPFKKKIWDIMHAVFKIKIFEKMLLPFVKGKYADTTIAAIAPYHHSYKNPTYRVAKKNELRLLANLHDYNDWKSYWGLKEIERENLYALAQHARTVIDIGTNNGWVLMNLASIIKKNDGFIYGFEPYPDTYKRCVENIKRSGIKNCEVFNMGCGDEESELEMETMDEKNSGQNRIVKINGRTSQKNTVKVKVTSLDKQLRDVHKIDLIKIDVEGFEMRVLKGAESLLKKYKPVIFIEINDPLLKKNNTSGAEVINFLKTQYHYTIKNAVTNETIAGIDIFQDRQTDVICYPPKND